MPVRTRLVERSGIGGTGGTIEGRRGAGGGERARVLEQVNAVVLARPRDMRRRLIGRWRLERQ